MKYVRQPRPLLPSFHLLQPRAANICIEMFCGCCVCCNCCCGCFPIRPRHATPLPPLSACTRLTAQFPNFNNYIRCMLQLTDCIGIDNGNGYGHGLQRTPPGSVRRSSAIFCHIFCGRYLHLVRVAAVAVAAAIAVAATKLICANCANCLRDKFMFANFN